MLYELEKLANKVFDDYTFPNPTVNTIKEEGGDFYSEIFI